MEPPPTDDDLETAVEVTAEIEHKVQPRRARLPHEAASPAPIATEELTESVPSSAPTNLQGRTGDEGIRSVDTGTERVVPDDDVDVASSTETEAESVLGEEAQNESRWHQLLAEATAAVDVTSDDTSHDDVIAESEPAPSPEPPKRRRLRPRSQPFTSTRRSRATLLTPTPNRHRCQPRLQ